MALSLTSACIEGPEPEHMSRIVPHACETALSANQTFEIGTNFPPQRLQADPPQFVLDLGATGGGTAIELVTSVGEYGTLVLEPVSPLPADTDMMLRLVEPGAVRDTLMPVWLPGRYSTRNAPAIRSYRAIEGRVFVSFTQRLDPATVATAVMVRQAGAPVRSEATYLDAPGRVIWVELPGRPTGLVEIVFAPTLRTELGDPVFTTETTLQLDPAYTPPAADGCEDFG